MPFNKGTSSYQWNKGVVGKACGVEPLRNGLRQCLQACADHDEGADNIFGCIGFMFLMHEAYSSLLFLFLCLQNDLGASKGRGNKYDVERTVLEKRLLYGSVFKSVIILKDKKNGELVVEEGKLDHLYKKLPRLFERFESAYGFMFLQAILFLITGT
ncbi:hypothetical protein L1887_32139 [Cichorium endivia]|nr:hypothetical protein L1887_32139 [Cichorium endivia]